MAESFIRCHPSTDERSVNLRWEGEWPPPEYLFLIHGNLGPAVLPAKMRSEGVLVRVSCSELTDEQLETMSHVARAALYVEDPEGWDGRS